MNCTQCKKGIEPGEEREHLGKILCEDCYIDALSPLKTCDPWSIHSAKTLEKYAGESPVLTPLQSRIIKILKEKGAMEPDQLLMELELDITLSDLEREFAMLRHMEKVGGKKQGNKILWRLK